MSTFAVGDLVDVVGPSDTGNIGRPIGPWRVRLVWHALKQCALECDPRYNGLTQNHYPFSSLRLHVPNQAKPPMPMIAPLETCVYTTSNGAIYDIAVDRSSIQMNHHGRPGTITIEWHVLSQRWDNTTVSPGIPSPSASANNQPCLTSAYAEITRLKQELQNAQAVATQQDAAYASLERDRDRLQQQVDGLRRELMPKPDKGIRGVVADVLGEIDMMLTAKDEHGKSKGVAIPHEIKVKVLDMLNPKEGA